MGRLKNLEKLRDQKNSYIRRAETANMKLVSEKKSGQLVVYAQNLNKNFANKCIINDFSIQIKRGDRIGIVGPNGIGKTTLLKILLGEIQPDSGEITLGSSLIIAKFDQLREQLATLKKESFNLRFQQATGQLENTARMRTVKRDTARVLTVLNQQADSGE